MKSIKSKRTISTLEESKSDSESTSKSTAAHQFQRKKLEMDPSPVLNPAVPIKLVFDRITSATPESEFEPLFDVLAEELINQYEYIVNGKHLRFRELEFYVNHPNHPDPYAHKDSDLKKMGGWYFHKIGKGYMGGSRKGHDITFGKEDFVAGILIRSIQDGTKIIDGCSLCVDYILEACHKTYPEIISVPTLVNHPKFKNDVLDQSAIMHINKLPENAQKFKFYKAPRVGLGDRWPEHRDKLYRYLVLPSKVKKGKPGLIWALLKSGMGRNEVQKLTGAVLSTIDKIASTIKGK